MQEQHSGRQQGDPEQGLHQQQGSGTQPRQEQPLELRHFFGSAVSRAENQELDEAYSLGYQKGHQAVTEQEGSAMQPGNRQTDRCPDDWKQKRGENISPIVKGRRNIAFTLGYQIGYEDGLQDQE